jgi:hypothetical protein
MAIRTGTSYFPGIWAARRYYAMYGLSKQDVAEKLVASEISIGNPPIKEGQKLVLIDSGMRWAIEEA